MDHSVEDYDDYEEYEVDDQEDEEEQEYEEVEERKPTREELEYLELRQRLKEQIRKQTKKDGSTGMNSNYKKKLPYDNFGSFFGPSQPVISQRVIQESKSLLENQHLASRVSNYLRGSKKSHDSKGAVSRPGGPPGAVSRPGGPPRVINEKKNKVQKLKDTRDYSFLFSEDAQFPAPVKESASQSIRAPSTEARSAHVPLKSKQPLGNHSQYVHGDLKDKKSVPMNGQIHSKNKLPRPGNNSSTLKPKKQLGSHSGNGPGRPVGPKAPSSVMQKRPSLLGTKNPLPSVRKPLPSKMEADRKNGLREPFKGKLAPSQLVASSKSQINKPQRPVSSRPVMSDQRPKKRPVRSYSDVEDDDDGGEAISLIRKMFGYNPAKFSGRDDDDSDMEANFDDIIMEEKRSEKIGRREDQEQLLLIQEEEERERRARLKRLKKARAG